MNYIGSLYGRIGKKHIKLEMTSEQVDKLEADNIVLINALKIVLDNSLNPAHTLTKLGLEECLDGCRTVALQALDKCGVQSETRSKA